MGWVTPKTWTDGIVVTAADLNTHIRDQFLALSTHAHTGAAGDGNDALTGLDEIILDFISDPSAPGSSKVILYSKAGGLFYREGAAGGVLQVSDAAHTHTFVEHAEGEAVNIGGENLTNLADQVTTTATHSTSFSMTISDTVQVVAFGAAGLEANTNNWELRLSIAGTDVDTDLTHSGSDLEPLKGSLARTSTATIQMSEQNNAGTTRNVGDVVAAIAINI